MTLIKVKPEPLFVGLSVTSYARYINNNLSEMEGCFGMLVHKNKSLPMYMRQKTYVMFNSKGDEINIASDSAVVQPVKESPEFIFFDFFLEQSPYAMREREALKFFTQEIKNQWPNLKSRYILLNPSTKLYMLAHPDTRSWGNLNQPKVYRLNLEEELRINVGGNAFLRPKCLRDK